MVYIYSLKLQSNKYYIGKTDNPNFRLENHFDSSGSAWTKKYNPISIHQVIPDQIIPDQINHNDSSFMEKATSGYVGLCESNNVTDGGELFD
jgi:hypothetical protein